MAIRPYRRPLLRRLALPTAAALYLGYFGFHAFHGSYGIEARSRFEAQAAELEAALGEVRAEANALERRAALLRPQSLDPDMIDERARQSLNVIGRNDLVIIP
jgi:cell division protein FtsB